MKSWLHKCRSSVKFERPGARSWLAVGVAVLLLAPCGCERNASVGANATPTAALFDPPPTADRAEPTASAEPEPQEPLPRSVADVALGMSHSELEQSLGKLTCEDRPSGYELCTGSRNMEPEARHLEVFFFENLVFSLAYETKAPDDILGFVDSKMAAYGKPVLNGLTDHDSKGRLHEIYGWRDEQTIYSLSFIWLEEEGQRRLSTVAIAIWDRVAYLEWEIKFGDSGEGPK